MMHLGRTKEITVSPGLVYVPIEGNAFVRMCVRKRGISQVNKGTGLIYSETWPRGKTDNTYTVALSPPKLPTLWTEITGQPIRVSSQAPGLFTFRNIIKVARCTGKALLHTRFLIWFQLPASVGVGLEIHRVPYCAYSGVILMQLKVSPCQLKSWKR